VDELLRSGIVLKPCPFCGAEAQLWRRRHHGDSPSMLVKCSGCHTAGAQFCWLQYENEPGQAEGAAAWWNKRS
jgi:Lar family restriction alleviation protein